VESLTPWSLYIDRPVSEIATPPHIFAGAGSKESDNGVTEDQWSRINYLA